MMEKYVVAPAGGAGGEIAPDCCRNTDESPTNTRPDRALGDGFAATTTSKVPGPVRAPAGTVTKPASAVAAHAQSAEAATVAVAVPPVATNEAFDRESPVTHDGGAAWETETVRPAIVSVPLRAAPPLAATAIDTEPLPIAAALLVTVRNGAFDVDVQLQFAPDVTATVTVNVCA